MGAKFLFEDINEPNLALIDCIRKYKPLGEVQETSANIPIARVILSETKVRKNLYADSRYVADALITAIAEY